MNIKPYDIRVQKLLQSAFFRIPRFQRPYSWSKANVEDFWDDVIGSGKSGHFIGSMVFYTEKTDQELFIVDGQQRLTTITIFLAALRDAFTDNGEHELAKGLQSLIERPDIFSNNRFILKTDTSFPYLQEYIQKHGAPELELEPNEEEIGIVEAYNAITSWLGETVSLIRIEGGAAQKVKKQIRDRLEVIRDAVLGLDLIVVQLENENDAHKVFETLNVRGRDLEPKDLIKNLLTKLIPKKSADVDQARIKWDGMMESISGASANIDPSAYLTHHWLSLYEYTTKATLYEKVKATINKDNAAGYLNDIVRDVDYYRAIFEPEAFEWQKEERPISRALEALGIFRMAQPAPFLLAILRAYNGQGLSLKQARSAIGVVEKFHFAYTAVAGQSSSGGVSKMYALAARGISSEQDEQKRAKFLQEFQSRLLSRLPEKERFVSGFQSLRLSQKETKDRALVRYILEELDRSGREAEEIDYSKMTIEHLAPQNPAGARPMKTYAMIGNLLFVTETLNGRLKNKPFSDKKKILLDAGVRLDDAVKNSNQWGDQEIEARTVALAEKLYVKPTMSKK